jgi:hypothetical protein
MLVLKKKKKFYKIIGFIFKEIYHNLVYIDIKNSHLKIKNKKLLVKYFRTNLSSLKLIMVLEISYLLRNRLIKSIIIVKDENILYFYNNIL